MNALGQGGGMRVSVSSHRDSRLAAKGGMHNKNRQRALQPMAQEHLKVWRNFHDVMNWSRENQIEEGSEHP